ncbi:MAG: hypothetical protein GY716_00505 [bacterium]|nr:hypothetical protein [bacterium]
MKRKLALLFATLMVVAAVAPTFAAQDEAKPWLEKLVSVYEKTPLRVHWTADISMSFGEMTMTAEMTGNQLIRDTTHQRMEMDMAMSMPQGKMETSMLMVSDGEHIWTETSMPGGMKQVGKMSIAKMEELGKEAGLQMNLKAMDPKQMLSMLQEYVDFKFLGREDGRVTLSGPLNPEMLSAMNMGQLQGAAGGDMSITVSLDEKTVIPMDFEIQIDGQKLATMNFNKVDYLSGSDVPEGSFSYTPAEGVAVMDLDAAMAGAQ